MRAIARRSVYLARGVGEMFERFTERARQVVILAQEEARTLGHDWIGTEHLLLGLMREEEGLAARTLVGLGLDLARVRENVVVVTRPSAAPVGRPTVTGQIPFTPRAKRVLELALREALARGCNYIGTEHVLAGLVREEGGVAARVLDEWGLDRDVVRHAIDVALTGGPQPQLESVVTADPERVPEERIDALIKQLRDVWRRYPQMRLCQLVVNVADKHDPFYVEDGDFEIALRRWASS